MLLEMYAVWWVVGEGRPGARAASASPSSRSSCISSRQQIRRGGEEKSKTTKMALVQSLMRTLVDCYFAHFKYLGCWCISTVCEENDTESEPLHIPDGLPHHQP